VNLSLEYGNSEASCYTYALLARTLGSYFGDYQAGHRFGTLSLELVDKRGLDRFKTRVYACFGHHIDPWKHHLVHSREWLRLAFAVAPQAGDLTFAAYNCVNTVGNLLASGEPLSNVQVEMEKGLAFARRLANGLAVAFSSRSAPILERSGALPRIWRTSMMPSSTRSNSSAIWMPIPN